MPYTARENVYVTSMGEGGKVVPEDDPTAGFLLVGKGGELSDELAEHYGLTGEKKAPAAEPKPAPKPAAEKAK